MSPAALRLTLALVLASTACSAETAPAPQATPKAETPAQRAPESTTTQPAPKQLPAPEKQQPSPAKSQPVVATQQQAPAASLPVAATPQPTAQAQAPASAPKAAPPAQKRAEPSRAQADKLTVAELIARRDLWPTKVAFKQMARLDEMTYWKEGEELPLYSWDQVNVVLDQGTFLFEWPAENTDVVERTRNLAAALSPEALALTVVALKGRPELWPVRLKTTVTLQFGGNTNVPAGREVALRFFEGNDLAVYDREVANYYTVAANETDVMVLARERLALPEAERAPFFVRSLESTLDPAGGKTSLVDADYVLVYSGRLGCMRCADFAPRLKDFYQRVKANAPEGAHFELVFMSNDANAEAAKKYLAEAGLPGGVIAFDMRLAAANLMTLELRTLPGFYVFDRAGNLVDRNHPDAGKPSADDVLAKFEARVKTPR